MIRKQRGKKTLYVTTKALRARKVLDEALNLAAPIYA